MNFSRTPQDSTAVIRFVEGFDGFLNSEGKSPISQPSQHLPTVVSDDSMCSGNTDISSHILDSKFNNSSVNDIKVKRSIDFDKSIEIYQHKSKIARLENRVETLDVEVKRARIDTNEEINASRAEFLNQRESKDELMRRLKLVAEREKSNHEQLNEYRIKVDQMKSNSEKKIEQFIDDKIKASEQFAEEVAKLRSEANIVKEKLQKSDSEIVKLQHLLKESESRLNQHENLLEKYKEQGKELDCYKMKATKADLRISVLEIENDKLRTEKSLSNTSETFLGKIKELEESCMILREENRRLIQNKRNGMLQTEEIENLKNKLARIEPLRLENAELKSRIEEYMAAFSKWKAIDENSKPISPDCLIGTVSDLRRKNSLLLESNGELNSKASQQNTANEALVTKLATAQKDLLAFKEKVELQAESIKRLEKRLLFVTKERDGIRNVLNSFNADDICDQAASQLLKTEKDLEACYKRIEQLEAEVESQRTLRRIDNRDLKERTVHLETKSPSNTSSTEYDALREPWRSISRERLAILEREKVEWLEEKESYEGIKEKKHLQGYYDPLTTKIIHFRNNPAFLAAENRKLVLQQLRRECDRLKEIILGSESSNPSNLKILQKEIRELREQLANAEKFNQRLKEIVREKIKVFREACYILTGYRIDDIGENRYKLQSIYAEHPGDYLIFSIATGGKVNLLETDFLNTIADLLDKYVSAYNAIPALLSAVTMQLFNLQTIQLTSSDAL
ncbi:Mitotic spindle assembly checkpoint protein MAD1 [Trichoplax sp. H2]|nr:Mitotic spindle assembly checkpoint protein MAD1 [Trichoplax sp. H2]|eukprot:RDD43909.1 Mitotic spindle assembly checkpoint protein MAD1 [Trichoplax sp. H2]